MMTNCKSVDSLNVFVILLLIHALLFPPSIDALRRLNKHEKEVVVKSTHRVKALNERVTEKIIRSRGYPVETHHVVTDDGFIVTLHRIPFSPFRNETKYERNKIPFFVANSMLGSSYVHVYATRTTSLGYILADYGYDVWLGNFRGTPYGRRHLTMDPDRDKTFWKFSWHEIGVYDYPAMIDYILMHTGYKKLITGGVSMAPTAYLAMTSIKPEYNEKILVFASLGVAGFTVNKLPLLHLIPKDVIRQFVEYAENMGMGELFKQGELSLSKIPFCNNGSFVDNPCFQLYCMAVDCTTDVLWDNGKERDIFYGQLPASISTRIVGHYAQLVFSGKFQQYDHGAHKNMELYGTNKPPEYNLTKTTSPTIVYWSPFDTVGSKEASLKMASLLGGAVEIHRINFKGFEHLSFALSKYAAKLIYYPMIRKHLPKYLPRNVTQIWS